MSRTPWIVPLLLVSGAQAQELEEEQPSVQSLLEELRELHARLDALEADREPPLGEYDEGGGIDLSGEELASIDGANSNHVLSQPWFENVDLGGYGALDYLDSGNAGTTPDGSFLVKEASLFLDAQVWERMSLYTEIWYTRYSFVNQFTLGEFYAQFTGLFAGDDGGRGLGVRVGRVYIPFGENYLWWDATENPLITFSAADPYGFDRGVVIYGDLGPAHWISSVTNGSLSAADDAAAKLVSGKVYGEPCGDLYLSASLLTTGNTERSAFRLGDNFITPVGVGASSSVGASPNDEVNTTCWELDAELGESLRASLALQVGRAYIDDDADAFDRDLTWFQIEPSVHLTDELDLIVRYSEIGTYDSDEGYLFTGRIVSTGENLGFDTRVLRRLSGGMRWDVNPHVIGKVEIGHDWFDLIDISP